MYPGAWGIALAAASLMGALAAPPRLGGGGGWLYALVAATLAINLATAFQTLQAARTVAVWAAYTFVFLFCAGIGSAREEEAAAQAARARRAVLVAIAAAGSLLAADGLYQSFYSFGRIAASAAEELPEAVRARIESGRAVATFGLPGALAGFLAISIPTTLALARGGAGGLRAALWLLAALQAAGLAATRSAAGLLSLAVASAIVVWRGGGGRRPVQGRRVAAALFAAGLAGAALLLATRLSGPSAADEGSGPLALRAGNWKVALQVLSEHPLFGAGAGCYGIAFPAHREWGMNESRFAHNSYLQLFAEGGLFLGALGLLLAGGLCRGLLGRSLAQERRPEDPWPGEAPFLATACLAFLLHNAADFTFYLPSVGFAFFCVAGLAAPARHARPRGAAVPALLVAAFALVVARADMALEQARASAAEPTAAARFAREAVRMNPFDPESRSLLALILLDREGGAAGGRDLAEAEAQALRAVDLDPRAPHRWRLLGRLKLARGDPQGAYIALARAAQLYPIHVPYREERDAVGAALAARRSRPGAAGAPR